MKWSARSIRERGSTASERRVRAPAKNGTRMRARRLPGRSNRYPGTGEVSRATTQRPAIIPWTISIRTQWPRR